MKAHTNTPAIELTWHEVAMASHVGWMRHLSAVRAGRPDRHGFTGDGWSEHCEGACGELAVAKLLGCYWDGSVDTFHAPDLPGKIQVRTRSRDDYELLVRPNDDDDARFVLVTGRAPVFVVRGWASGAESKRFEWLQHHGNRAGAYFVPQHALHPIASLTASLMDSSMAARRMRLLDNTEEPQ